MLQEGLRNILNTTSAGGSAGIQHLPKGLPGLQTHLPCLFIARLKEELGDTCTSSASGLLCFLSGDDLLGDEQQKPVGVLEKMPGLAEGSSGGLRKTVDGPECPSTVFLSPPEYMIIALESSDSLDGPDTVKSEHGLEDTEQF